MIRNFLQSALLILLAATVLPAQDRASLIKSVNSMPGWATLGTPESYNDAALDRFDPAVAPALRLYGVNGVTVQSWQTPGGKVQATLFQLVHSSAADGFFTLRRHAESTSL